MSLGCLQALPLAALGLCPGAGSGIAPQKYGYLRKIVKNAG